MMNKLIALGGILILLLGGCAVVTAVLRPTADNAVNQIVDHAFNDDPLNDAVKVYETIGGGNGRTWAPIALTLIVVLVGGGVLAYLKFAPEHAKQKRHLLREQKRGLRPSASPRSWVVPQAPALPRAEELPLLPDHTGDSNNWVN